MSHERLAIFLIVMVVLFSTADADWWSSTLATNTSFWDIYRQSSNISFELYGSVNGKISPIDLHNRSMQAYCSYYAQIVTNDVSLSERTNALDGEYESSEGIELESSTTGNEIDASVVKPSGSDVFTFSYYEQWPTKLEAIRTIDYRGKRVNDRDFEANNGDFVGSTTFYNHELSKEQGAVMWLQRMNVTVLSTNDSILHAELEPTKYLGYLIRSHADGVSDLSYRFSDPQYDLKRHRYPALSEGNERYYGSVDLSRKIEMRSSCENFGNESDFDWLPCCNADFDESIFPIRIYLRPSARDIFDCTCRKTIAKS